MSLFEVLVVNAAWFEKAEIATAPGPEGGGARGAHERLASYRRQRWAMEGKHLGPKGAAG